MVMERGESFNSTKFTKLKCSLEVKIEDNRKNFEALSYFKHNAWPRYPIIKIVPHMLREENKQAYTPSIVSIGPLHSRNEFLKAMEADKLSYMRFLFERTEKFEQTRNDCVKAMLKMEKTLEKCYPDPAKQVEDHVSSSGLIEMMVIDGCFIIELIYRHYTKEKDPILQDLYRYSAILRDLLLLENQIPFDVLEKLFSLTVQRIPTGGASSSTSTSTPTLIGCLLPFFGDIMGLEDTSDIRKKDKTPNPYHILHLLHICYQPDPLVPVPVEDIDTSSGQDQPQGESGRTTTASIQPVEVDINNNNAATAAAAGGGGIGAYQGEEKPAGFEGSTATQLDIAGVKLRKHKTRNLFDVNFSSTDQDTTTFYYFRIGGHLEIPRFSVYYFTESFLRNLIAFEQCCPLIESFFTSHAFLMDVLIDSVEDVKLLEKAGVICNHLGSDESVLQIFNGISKNAFPRNFHYHEQWRKMKGCCTPWQVQLGILKRNFAGNLWIVLSVIGAILLFVLTLLQTIYTMLSYHRPM